jgi:uncharacterized lipoprotein YmbA
MMRANAKLILTLLGCGLCMLAGCVDIGSGTSEITRLYVLSPMTTTASPVASQQDGDFALGVGPLILPSYLKRPQVVTRIEDNEIVAADFANWAEPLDRSFQRALTENLSLLLGTDAVYPHPWRRTLRPTYRLQMEVIRFDANPTGDAVLTVRWEVLDTRGQPLTDKKRSDYRQAVANDTIADVVTAMSLTLADFSREVAVAIAAL